MIIDFFSKPEGNFYDCDVVIIDSKYRQFEWANNSASILDELAFIKNKVKTVIYVDNVDSSGFDHAKTLPIVTRYLKSQLLRDRSLYLKPLYGYRLFTDYYHEKFGIKDNQPDWTQPILPQYTSKMGLSWNSGLANYSLHGPLLNKIYKKIPFAGLLYYSKRFTSPKSVRKHPFSCRFGFNYNRDSVSWQRKRIHEIMKERGGFCTKKVNRRQYLNELRDSKIIVSPFGFGEITLKDFEAFMTGGVLLKPDMTHMETWPNFFQDQKTMISFAWDLSDFTEKLEYAVSNHEKLIDIAITAQELYKKHTIGSEAGALFSTRLRTILDESLHLEESSTHRFMEK